MPLSHNTLLNTASIISVIHSIVYIYIQTYTWSECYPSGRTNPKPLLGAQKGFQKRCSSSEEFCGTEDKSVHETVGWVGRPMRHWPREQQAEEVYNNEGGIEYMV